jgi:hypothetical protein
MRSFSEIIKDSPSVGDVHIASTGRKRRGQMNVSMIGNAAQTAAKAAEASVSFYVPISKINEELRTVYGWASINTEGGALVTDHQDDQVDDAEIIKAAHDFMTNSRHGGLLHARTALGGAHRGGSIVESLVLTPDVQKALGIDLGKTGWFVGYRVDDPDAWELVKSKPPILKAFSIGGRARRVPQ